jgi:predicted protein tyrosine phosphatase
MKEIYTNLWIGNSQDFELVVKEKPGWMIVHACKEPYHRQLLGYTTRGAPKDHPEYLMARRGNRLYLNLVDAPNPDFFDKRIIDAALGFIDEGLENKNKVLVHCNLGESRSPSIGMLYLASRTEQLPKSFSEAEIAFRKIYPDYNPSVGIREFIRQNWQNYVFSK